MIVPWPPKSATSTSIFPSASDISRSVTSLSCGCPFTPFAYDRKTSHFPSGDGWGNQLLNSSPVTGSWPLPSACMRQICMAPVRTELK